LPQHRLWLSPQADRIAEGKPIPDQEVVK
jgi:hypothetical protein